jgi:uncharacterized protein (TIRG00374 family)
VTADEGLRDLPPGAPEEDEADESRTVAAIFEDRRRLALIALAFVLVILAVYVLLPNVVGLRGALSRIGDATWYWIAAGILCTVASFAAYVALFRGILGGLSEPALDRRLGVRASYEITMAGLAASRVFSAAGAGGIVVTYWALRNAGMDRRVAAGRMVAFLALLYSVYLAALVLFGVLLRTGVLPGPAPAGGTIVPAAVAGAVIVTTMLVALIPGDVERRLRQVAGIHGHQRLARLGARLASGPATVAAGVRTAISYARHPRQGALAIAGAIGFWSANIATLWVSFEAFGGDVSFGVVVQGFFVGMAANLIPSPAGGVGSVDAGMIASFLLFGVPGEIVFPAVLTYRVLAFWLPIPPGIVAYFQLRRTVSAWREERSGRYTIKSEVTPQAL